MSSHPCDMWAIAKICVRSVGDGSGKLMPDDVMSLIEATDADHPSLDPL